MPLTQQARNGPPPTSRSPTEVEVAVLGPVEIRGAAQPFRRTAARELVVYLAFHRQGVRSDVWSAALWNDRSIAQSTLHSTASVARSALGRSKDGMEHLPRSGRLLRLGDTVGADVERFALLAAAPGPESWREALGLVRGRLFDGLSLSDWTVLDGTQASIEAMVVGTALKAASHSLSLARGEEAQWAVRQGLLVSPYDERLYRSLLRATEVMGNRVGLHAAMEELLCLAGGGDPPRRGRAPGTWGESALDIVHPETLALFAQLARGGTGAAGREPSRL